MSTTAAVVCVIALEVGKEATVKEILVKGRLDLLR